jgi:uncharacterized protein
VDFEWDSVKAAKNLRKHGVSFEEASSVFYDPLATTGADPDHSENEDSLITFGASSAGRLLVVSHIECNEVMRISALAERPLMKGGFMKKAKAATDDLRAEYKRSDFKKLERGKYYEKVKARSNVVLLDPEVAAVFPNSTAVNKALRSLAEIGGAKL